MNTPDKPELDTTQKQWVWINPTGQIDFQETLVTVELLILGVAAVSYIASGLSVYTLRIFLVACAAVVCGFFLFCLLYLRRR